MNQRLEAARLIILLAQRLGMNPGDVALPLQTLGAKLPILTMEDCQTLAACEDIYHNRQTIRAAFPQP